jgi:hypothetical protein
LMIKKIILVLLAFVLMLLLFSNDSRNNAFEQLVSEVKSKGYEVEVVNAPRDFLSGTRKRILTHNETIDVYLYRTHFTMERDAKGITLDGFGYDGLLKKVRVSWVGKPHFYKKGNLIVQYIGSNDEIISDLKDIFGEQFAGHKNR